MEKLLSCASRFGIALMLLAVAAGELQLRQSVIISRHGSRSLLEKDHRTFVEPRDSQLTVRGMDQMLRAGQFVRGHYNSTTPEFLSMLYNPREIHVRSSDYSRTLNSASSFLLGLYPPVQQKITSTTGTYEAPYNIQQIPIHAVPAQNDQLLRGWMSCPALQTRLDKFFASEEFKAKERENQDLFTELEQITGVQKVELKNFYNVYDLLNLRSIYNHTSLNLTEAQWRRVQELGDWIEYGKYGPGIVGSISGGILANEIAAGFQATVNSKGKAKSIFYSAHYPTIVSLFSALGLNKEPGPLRKIPNYASLVFMELYQKSEKSPDFFVKFSFKDGLEEKVHNCKIPGCKSELCTLNEFVSLTNGLGVRDMTSWCDACNNKEHPLCHVSTCVTTSCDRPAFTAVAGFFTGVLTALAILAFSLGIWYLLLKGRCRMPIKRASRNSPQQEYSQFHSSFHDAL